MLTVRFDNSHRDSTTACGARAWKRRPLRRISSGGATPGPAHPSRLSGISTTLARRYSPSVFACGSLRSEAATPSPSRPFTTKLSASRLGSAWRSTSRSRASLIRDCEALDGQVRRQPGDTPPGCAPRRRRWRCRPCRPSARRTRGRAAPRASRPAGGAGSAGARAAGGRKRAGSATGGTSTTSSPITTRCATASDGDQRRPEHADLRRVARRPGAGEAGVAGERHLDRRAAEAAADLLLVGVAHGDRQVGEGLLVAVRIGVIAAPQRHPRLGELGATADQVPQRLLGQPRLLLDVEPGEDEGHRVLPAAGVVDAHLGGRRRRLAARAAARGRGRAPPAATTIVSKRAVTSGFAYAGAPIS